LFNNRILGLLICLMLLGVIALNFGSGDAAAQGGTEGPMFTLSLLDSTNNTVEYTNEISLSFQINVLNNWIEAENATITMSHSVNDNSTDMVVIEGPEMIKMNESEVFHFTISLDAPLDILVGDTKSINFTVRPLNESLGGIQDFLVVTLKAIAFYDFEITEIETSGYHDEPKEGDDIIFTIQGNHNSNEETTLKFSLFVDDKEVDSVSGDYAKFSQVEVELEWEDSTPGNHTTEVVIYKDNEDETFDILSEEMDDIEVEKKFNIPWFYWIGAGVFIVMILIILTIVVKRNKEEFLKENGEEVDLQVIMPSTSAVAMEKEGETDKNQKGSQGTEVSKDTSSEKAEEKKDKKKKGKKKKKKGKKKTTTAPVTGQSPPPETGPVTGPTGIPPAQQQAVPNPTYIQTKPMAQTQPPTYTKPQPMSQSQPVVTGQPPTQAQGQTQPVTPASQPISQAMTQPTPQVTTPPVQPRTEKQQP